MPESGVGVHNRTRHQLGAEHKWDICDCLFRASLTNILLKAPIFQKYDGTRLKVIRSDNQKLLVPLLSPFLVHLHILNY